MRLRDLAVPLALALLLLVPASASAAARVGISDNRPQMFSDPNFAALGVKQTRIVVSYDAIEAGLNGDDEISSRVAPYLATAAALGIEPLVSFEHSRGAAEVCKSKRNRRRLKVCYLPKPSEYRQAITAFLLRFPEVRVISPWNEVNHFTQGTSRSPKRAAQFTDIANSVCKQLGRRCTIVAMDILDAANNTSSRRPKFTSTVRYIKKFRRKLKMRRNICGIHNYSDVNRFRRKGTKVLMRAMRCRQYWLTETGGLYDFGSFWNRSTRKRYKCRSAAKCQLKATRYLFKIVRKERRIKRVYIHNWFGGSEPCFDAGLVEGVPGGGPTKPRPAYRVVKKKV